MALPRPRVQTLAILAICVVIVVAFARYNGTFQRKNDTMNQAYLASYQFVTTTPAVSADLLNSTSTDWKKAFFNNAIGASTSSNAYGYNGTSANRSTSTLKLTDTDIFGRNLLVAYSGLQQAGQADNGEAVSAAASQLVSDAVSRIPAPSEYSAKDIITVESSPSTAYSYGVSVASIMKDDMPKDNEAVLVSDALDKNNMALLSKVDPIIASYKTALTKLLALSVPKDILESHLELINSVSMQLFNAQVLRNVDNNPIGALAGVGQEKQALESMQEALSNIQKYLNDTATI